MNYSRLKVFVSIIGNIQTHSFTLIDVAQSFVDLRKAFDKVDHDIYTWKTLITIVLKVLQKTGSWEETIVCEWKWEFSNPTNLVRCSTRHMFSSISFLHLLVKHTPLQFVTLPCYLFSPLLKLFRNIGEFGAKRIFYRPSDT